MKKRRRRRVVKKLLMFPIMFANLTKMRAAKSPQATKLMFLLKKTLK